MLRELSPPRRNHLSASFISIIYQHHSAHVAQPFPAFPQDLGRQTHPQRWASDDITFDKVSTVVKCPTPAIVDEIELANSPVLLALPISTSQGRLKSIEPSAPAPYPRG